MAKNYGRPLLARPFNILFPVVMVVGSILLLTIESVKYRGLVGMIVTLFFGIHVGPRLRIWDSRDNDPGQSTTEHKQEHPCHQH